MFVQWDHVQVESFYRAIRGYNVIAREEENPSMIVVNTTQDTSTTSLTLSGLKKFTLYNIQVAAFSSENGPFLNVTVKTAEDSKYQWLIMRSGIMFVYTSKPHNLVRFQAFWFFLPPSYMHQNDKYA